MKIQLAVAIVLGVTLAGCQSPGQVISAKENLLAAAGFVAKPAVSAEQQASMKKLPPNKFVRQTQNNRLLYLYSDPIVCQCVYAGDQAAYSKYSQMVFQKNLADEQQATANMEAQPFDFYPWGGMWGYGY